MKKLYLLFTLMVLMVLKTMAQPAAAPTAPKARPVANVISIYGTTYGNHAGTDFDPNWGQNGFNNASEITIGSEKIRKYANLNYQGIDFGGAINLAAMDSLHLDIWTPDVTKLDIYLIGSNPNNEKFVTANLTLSGWNSISIPLSAYTSQGLSMNSIIQFKFVSNTPVSGTTIYLDNIYFWTESSVPTLSNFTVPTGKKTTDGSFTLTPPTSNSNGAFTYTSSNLNVATISGTTVTIVGAGTSTITASQAPSGGYGAGSINATLNIGYDFPTTAAPVPGNASSDVISLLSSAYTNKTVNTWGASWQSAVLFDTTLQGSPTKRYSNLNFSGTEFTGANSIDATAMNYFHVDLWTPNSTAVKVKLVDFGADNAFGGGDDKTSIEYVLDAHPTPNAWHSYNVPMTAFTGLDTRAHLSQMLFVGSTTVIFIENVYFSKLATLPVGLNDFKGSKVGNSALLNWKTSFESNNKGFYVERSKDGLKWAQLFFVNGKGNSTVTNKYEAKDLNPLNGLNYYRIKQVDLNGKETFSTIVTLNFSELNGLNFSFYPNPAVNRINVLFRNIENNNATIDLVNSNGLTVRSVALNKTNSNTNLQINVESIPKGIYVLMLKDGQNISSTKVMIH